MRTCHKVSKRLSVTALRRFVEFYCTHNDKICVICETNQPRLAQKCTRAREKSISAFACV